MADDKIILREFLPYQLTNLAQRVSHNLATTYREKFNLSIAQWRVLAYLGENSTATAKTIAKQSFMDKVKTSRAIKEMSGKHLLLKKRDSNDSRAYWVSLSQPGVKLYRAVVPYALAWQAEFLSSLSVTEYKQFMQILTSLNTHMDSVE